MHAVLSSCVQLHAGTQQLAGTVHYHVHACTRHLPLKCMFCPQLHFITMAGNASMWKSKASGNSYEPMGFSIQSALAAAIMLQS